MSSGSQPSGLIVPAYMHSLLAIARAFVRRTSHVLYHNFLRCIE